MPTGADRYGKCESCETLAQLRFSRSPAEKFGWICVRCRAKNGQRLDPAEVDVIQAEQFTSEHMLRAASFQSSPPDPKAAAPEENRTILVVEDDDDIRGAACAILRMDGFSVLEVTNGKEALDLLAKLETKPRLILLDLWMPVMSGWDFYERVSRDRELRTISVIILTAYDLKPNVGSLKWLRKPIGMDTLLEAVRACWTS